MEKNIEGKPSQQLYSFHIRGDSIKETPYEDTTTTIHIPYLQIYGTIYMHPFPILVQLDNTNV